MRQGVEATQEPLASIGKPHAQAIGGFGPGKLALITLCAFVGTLAGNAIYGVIGQARAAYAFREMTRPSASYLKATRLPPVDADRVDEAVSDFYFAYNEASIPHLLITADKCWADYDAKPSWRQFDYCVGYDMALSANVSPREIEAHAEQSTYPSVIERKANSYFVRKAERLGGEVAVVQRVNEIALNIQIGNR